MGRNFGEAGWKADEIGKGFERQRSRIDASVSGIGKSVSGIRGPLWPSNEVMDELLASNLPHDGAASRWKNDNLANICGQKRDAGKRCEWTPTE